MMSLTINTYPVKTFTFSGGERHLSVKDIPLTGDVSIEASLFNSDDVITLLLAVDAVRRLCPAAKINLALPYVPYARQDRVCNVGEPLSIAVIADLINNLNCASVTILDPHSDVTPALIKNVRIISQADLISNSAALCELIKDHAIHLMAPDAGAEKKTRTLAKALHDKGIEAPALFASKERDVRTGDILKTIIPADVAGKNFLIADDICDGGMTFILLSKELKAHGAKDIYLYVTHGIFSKGTDELKTYFKHVYCHHSFSNLKDTDFVTVLEDVKCK